MKVTELKTHVFENLRSDRQRWIATTRRVMAEFPCSQETVRQFVDAVLRWSLSCALEASPLMEIETVLEKTRRYTQRIFDDEKNLRQDFVRSHKYNMRNDRQQMASPTIPGVDLGEQFVTIMNEQDLSERQWIIKSKIGPDIEMWISRLKSAFKEEGKPPPEPEKLQEFVIHTLESVKRECEIRGGSEESIDDTVLLIGKEMDGLFGMSSWELVTMYEKSKEPPSGTQVA